MLAALLWVVSQNTFSGEAITVTGYGSEYGVMNATVEAKKNVLEEAEDFCQSPIQQVGDWETKVVRRVEGFITVRAQSQFECLHDPL